jgi:hypothetical protein
LVPKLPTYLSQLSAILSDSSASNAFLRSDAQHILGALTVSVVSTKVSAFDMMVLKTLTYLEVKYMGCHGLLILLVCFVHFIHVL